MIVECPQCSSKYRVKDEKIPDSGGRISCPSCGEKFVVHPDDDSRNEQTDRRSSAGGSGLEQMAEGMEGTEEQPTAPDQDPTEVMTGDNAPAFLGDRTDEEDEEGEDATTEMRNPFLDAGADDPEAVAEDLAASDDATEVVNTGDLGEEFGGEGWFGDDEAQGSKEPGAGDAAAAGAPTEREFEGGTIERKETDVSESVGDSAEPTRISSPGTDGPQGGSRGPADDDSSRGGSRGASGGRGREQRDSSVGGHQSGRSSGGDAPLGRDRRDSAPGADPSRQTPGSAPDSNSPPRPPDEGAPSPDSGRAAPAGGTGRGTPDGHSGRSGAQAGGGSPAPNHDGPWKLKAEHGLTYEFPDTQALRDWLIDREEVENLELSPDESNFYALSRFPQVADVVGEGVEPAATSGEDDPSRRAPSGGSEPHGTGGGSNRGAGGGGGAVETGDPPGSQRSGAPDRGRSSSPQQPASSGAPPQPASSGGPRQQPQSGGMPDAPSPASPQDAGDISAEASEVVARDSSWTLILYGVLGVLVLIAVGVFLDVSGTYPVGAKIPGLPTTFDDSPPTATPSAGSGATAGAAANSQATEPDASSGTEEGADEVDRLLRAAENSIQNNRMQTAIEKLSAAKLLEPKRARTYELLGEVYAKLGQDQKAEQNRNKARRLRGKGAGPAADAGDVATSADAGD